MEVSNGCQMAISRVVWDQRVRRRPSRRAACLGFVVGGLLGGAAGLFVLSAMVALFDPEWQEYARRIRFAATLCCAASFTVMSSAVILGELRAITSRVANAAVPMR
jgi:uncharacterized membrane protein YfcA